MREEEHSRWTETDSVSVAHLTAAVEMNIERKGLIVAIQLIMCCIFMVAWRVLAPVAAVEPSIAGRDLLIAAALLCALATLFTALNHTRWQNVVLFVLMWIVGSYIAIQRSGLGYAYEGDPGVFPLSASLIPVAPAILYIVFVHWVSHRVRGRRSTTIGGPTP